MTRTICVVTGTRAEYGLLYWLMREIRDDPALTLQLVVTGAHLVAEFGETARVIEQDGFRIDRTVDMQLTDDTPAGIARSMGLALSGFGEAFAELRPDLVVVLGDRYEILAAAAAAMVARIPIAHLHGGETTEGAIDEAIRHSVTKMAHLHFVAAEEYRKRVIQLGESPERVFAFGAPALDNLERLTLLDRAALERALEFELGPLSFLVTYHPVTLDPRGPQPAMEALLAALSQFPAARIIFTKSNADAEGRLVNRLIDAYAAANAGRVLAVASLGQVRYLSAMWQADVVIGNSSSGIIEAPLLKKPTVNAGARQRGRLKASSIIDCDESAESIAAAIRTALSPEFRATLPATRSLYGETGVATRIKDILANVRLDDLLMKRFYDLPLEAMRTAP